MISDIVASGIADLDGFLFDAADKCPYCGGELKSHDTKRRVFARINTGILSNDTPYPDTAASEQTGTKDKNHERNITVNVKRWYCTECGKLVYSRSPFYEGIRTGAPIVDFCVVNSEIHPPNHIAKILGKLGIIVTPATVRNILQLRMTDLSNPEKIPAVNIYGVMFPSSLLSISEQIRKGRT